MRTLPTFLIVCLVATLASTLLRAQDAPQPQPKLVIVKAVYGDLPSGPSIDVTKKVADMVKDNALTVEATNDNFTDPAEGVEKTLQVEYTIAGLPRVKTVKENETLTIPAGEKPPKLVIRKAVYGDLPAGPSVDVTKIVAAAVKDDALSIEATNDNFTDPADGIEKKLRVDYTFNGAEKSKTAEENQPLTITNTGD